LGVSQTLLNTTTILQRDHIHIFNMVRNAAATLHIKCDKTW